MKRFLILIFCGVLTLTLSAQDLVPYLDGSQYGYSDIDGKIVISPKFDKAGFFNEDGLAQIVLDEKSWVINKKGDLLFETEEGQQLTLLPVVSFKETKQFKGHISTQYDTIPHLKKTFNDYKHFRFINFNNDKTSALLEHDQTHLAISFRRRSEAVFNDGVFIAKRADGDFVLLDTDLNILKQSSGAIIRLSKDYVTYPQNKNSELYKLSSNSSLTFPYQNIHELVGDKLIVSQSYNRKGLIDFEGKMLIDTIYQNLYGTQFGHIIAFDKGYYLYDDSGKKLTQIKLKRISTLNDKYYVFVDSLGVSRILDASLKPVLNQEFENIKHLKAEQYYNWQAGNYAGILDSNLINEITIEAESIYRAHANGYYIFKKDDKTGVINKNKKVIIEPEFDQIYQYDSLHFRLELNDKKGLTDLAGKILFQAAYSDIRIERKDEDIYYLVKKEEHYACYDQNLNQLSGYTNKHGSLTSSLLRWDRKDKQVSFQDRFNNPLGIVADDFNHAEVKSDSTKIAVYQKDEKQFAFIIEKEMVDENFKPKLNYIGDQNNQPFLIEKANLYEGIFIFKTDSGKQGIINHKNKITLEAADREIAFMDQAYAVFKEKEKYVIYNFDGKRLNKKGYDYVSDSGSQGIRSVANITPEKTFKKAVLNFENCEVDTVIAPQRKFGALDKNGNLFIPLEYSRTFRYLEKYCIFVKGFVDGQKQTRLLDKQGNIVLETDYDNLYPIQHTDTTGLYRATLKNKEGLIDVKGNLIISPSYKSITRLNGSNLFLANKEDDQTNLINIKNEIIFENIILERIDYEYCKKLSKNKLLLYLNGASEIIDADGNKLLHLDSQDISIITVDDKKWLEVNGNTKAYYINIDNLFSYKN